MSKKKLLEEIKETCRKAIRKTEDHVLNKEVIETDKKSFVSVGGCFDSIIILVEELEKEIRNENNSEN